MNGPLVPLDWIANFTVVWRRAGFGTRAFRIGGGVNRSARQEELFTARHLEIEPNRFPICAPELMAGDFVGHGAFVHQSKVGPVYMYLPDAIEFVPRTFVAEHEKPGIGRRKLNMAEPAFVAIEAVGLASGNINREKTLRTFRIERLLEPCGARPTAINRLPPVDKCAGQKGIVGVDGACAPTAREVCDLFRFASVDMSRVKSARALVIHDWTFLTHHR